MALDMPPTTPPNFSVQFSMATTANVYTIPFA
jgi:hypothetical protein